MEAGGDSTKSRPDWGGYDQEVATAPALGVQGPDFLSMVENVLSSVVVCGQES